MEKYLTTAEAAEFIGRSVGTMRNYRINGQGPRFYKRRGKALYKRQDLIDWVEGSEPAPAADDKAAG